MKRRDKLILEAAIYIAVIIVGAWLVTAKARGNPSGAADFVIQRTLTLQGVISPTAITANQNNYNPTSLSIALRLRLTTDASRTVTGLTLGADGLVRIIHNVGVNPLILTNEDSSSTAANRFALGADLTLTSGTGVILIYDGTSSRWRGLGGQSAISGGGGSATWGSIGGTISAQADLGSALGAKANIASPTFTGVAAAPTASADTNTTQLATTGFVIGQSYLKTATAASTYQPLDSDLTAIAALSTSSAGRSLLAISSLTAAGLGLTNGATIDSWGGKTVPAGTVVGTSDAQSLLNKKLGSLTSNGFVKTTGGDGTLSVDTATYLTANQTVALSGDATGSGTTTITVNVGKINGTALSGLATGILKNTTTTGVPSIAVSGTDYAPATSGSAILKGNGSGGFSAAASGTDYEVPITFTTGLTRSLNTVTVNTSQNIAKLSNLTSNGFVKTSGGDGTFSIDTGTYLTTAAAAAAYQPLDFDLTSIAALSTSTYGRSLLTASALTANGLGLTNGSNIDSWGGKTVPAGDPVGTSDSQSLANKKLGSLTSNGFVKTSGGDGTLSVDTTTYLTGNQAITLSGDATGTGTTTITVNVGKINGTSLASLSTGLLKSTTSSGNISIASAGTDYAPATSGSAILKGNGSGGFSAAVSSTDYAPATSGSALLKGNGSGGFSSAVSATDYAPATSGSAILKGNGSGGFSAASAGTDYSVPTNVQVFTTPGSQTWTKPTGAKWVSVWCIGGGGGGGSGRKGAAASARNGGGGGGGGGFSTVEVSASLLGSTETVTVGAGGTGGASQTSNSSNGNFGVAGGTSSLGSWVLAGGGNPGIGGTAGAGSGGIGGHAMYAGGQGQSATNDGTATVVGSAGGGAGGGSINSSNVLSASGGTGGTGSTYVTPAAGGAGGTSDGQAGAAGTSNTANNASGGGAGGGGRGSLLTDGGAGGVGGLYGGAGSGGGASVDSVGNSGAGGAGAGGIVIVVTHF